MAKSKNNSVVAEPLSVCQNCGKKFTEAKLEEITHGFWERVSPGEICPSGECPSCGSLCSPEPNALTPYVAALRMALPLLDEYYPKEAKKVRALLGPGSAS
jgi:hypothetical protein